MGCLIDDEADLQQKSAVSRNSNTAENVPFVENLRQLWLAGFACDVFFAVGLECKRFAAHRIVLAAGSKYFSDYFFSHERKVGLSTYELPIEVFDITPDAMKTVLNFLYSNQNPSDVTLNSKSVVHVLYAAEKYRIANLRIACLHHLQNMNGKNCVQILRQAMFYHEELLIKKCLSIIDENADEVLNSEGFLDCDRDTIAILINRESFRPSREFPLFMALFSWSIVECDRLGLDITSKNQREVLGGLIILVNLQALTKEEIADAVRTGLVTAEEVVQYVPNPWDPRVTNLFEDVDDSISGFQQLAVSKNGYVTISLNSNELEGEENSPGKTSSITTTNHVSHASGTKHDLYYTVSRFQHTLKSSTTTNSIKLIWIVNRNIDVLGFSMFGFCSGRNDDIFQYKPTVTFRKLHGLHVAATEKIETDVVPFKNLIRFMFKEKKRIKRDKKYTLDIKFEGMAQRTRYEGFGEINPVIKVHNGDSVAFKFDSDRYIAELYFIPTETIGRITMLPLKTDFIRNLSETTPSPLKLHGSRWTS